ncbi:MAG: DUF1700 domain-containing protein, partial [Bacteroidaceae bacterium]|nr:DUF1700 domain-containing protein [Bacteroidaceae bacterium]
MAVIDRRSYMAELKNLLRSLPKEEREAAILEYEARFDAAGVDGEFDLLRELGSPMRQVVLLEREYRLRREGRSESVRSLPAQKTEKEAEEVPVPEETAEETPVPEKETEDVPVPEEPTEESPAPEET